MRADVRRDTSEKEPRSPPDYTGWSLHVVHPDSALVNEVLLYAYPTKGSEPPADQSVSEAVNVAISQLQHTLRSTRTDTPSGVDDAALEGDDLEDELSLRQSELEDLQDLCTPLQIDNRCNLCAIVSICLEQDEKKRWLLDYGLLCYKCSSAPRTAMSTLIAGCEFLYLLKRHFPGIDFSNALKERIITVFDFHTHFFINRCFAGQEGDPITNENITLNHIAVTRCLIMREENIPYNKNKRAAVQRVRGRKDARGHEGTDSLLTHSSPSSDCFTPLLFYMWAGTNVMFNTTVTDLAIKKHRQMSLVEDRACEVDRCVGPIYLSPTPVFAMKNQTTTVCLLCELMACSYKDNLLLRDIRHKVVTYCQNNLKLVDRIQLTLAELLRSCDVPSDTRTRGRDVSTHVSSAPTQSCSQTLDKLSYLVIKQAGVTGIYKHFFCDPQCAANIKCTRPEVLFGVVHADRLREVKLAICCDNTYPNLVHRQVWLYAQIFKAFQIAKRNFRAKTQLADFLKDFRQLLDAHEFELVDPSFVVDKYV
uniref:DNA packaging protein UL32 n=1 Tax=Cardioderma bat herpesvirus TaxID=3141914 RepID=A0AAU7E1L3_9VIRU